jgi:hypothetical protein
MRVALALSVFAILAGSERPSEACKVSKDSYAGLLHAEPAGARPFIRVGNVDPKKLRATQVPSTCAPNTICAGSDVAAPQGRSAVESANSDHRGHEANMANLA